MTALSLDDVKAYLRYTNDSSDGPLTLMLKAGQNWVERYTSHLLTQREVTQTASTFKAFHDLRWRPFVPDSLSISYLDANMAEQAHGSFASYLVGDAGRVVPFGSWPTSARGVTFTYQAGYETPDEVPDLYLQAIALYVGMSDEERTAFAAGGQTALHFMLEDHHQPVIA